MQVTRVGADCDIKSSRFSQTPAHLAAFGGHPQCLQWLLQAGATVDMQVIAGVNKVHYLILYSYLVMCQCSGSQLGVSKHLKI